MLDGLAQEDGSKALLVAPARRVQDLELLLEGPGSGLCRFLEDSQFLKPCVFGMQLSSGSRLQAPGSRLQVKKLGFWALGFSIRRLEHHIWRFRLGLLHEPLERIAFGAAKFLLHTKHDHPTMPTDQKERLVSTCTFAFYR